MKRISCGIRGGPDFRYWDRDHKKSILPSRMRVIQTPFLGINAFPPFRGGMWSSKKTSTYSSFFKTKATPTGMPSAKGDDSVNATHHPSDKLSALQSLFKSCLDVLRDNEHLVNDKALRTLTFLIILKCLEDLIEQNQIDFDNVQYNMRTLQLINYKPSDLIKFSNFLKIKKQNLTPSYFQALWDDLLAQHPITKHIFLKGQGLGIKNTSTFETLIKKIHQFSFSPSNFDIQGFAYEEVIKNTMTGKYLGQFFTPTSIKQIMVSLVKPQVKSDGTIETIFDPALGTGGFLITCLNYLVQQAKTQDISLNWNFISTKGLGGREVEPDTYQLARGNMLISSGQIFKNLELNDSIKNPINNQYDIVLTNVPFGIKTLNYNDIQHDFKSLHLPIKTNNGVLLFLQAIVHILKIGGRAAIVLPFGQEIFSQKKEFVAVREFLIKTCYVKQIIQLPKGIFTHTSVETCIIYFIKKIDGSKILNTKIKYSDKTNKEISRSYNFKNVHYTPKISICHLVENFETFPPIPPSGGCKETLGGSFTNNQVFGEKLFEKLHWVGEISITQMEKMNYSFHFSDYRINEQLSQQNKNLIYKTLGEICEFASISKRQASYGQEKGKYPFFTSSLKVKSFVDDPDYKTESIIMGTVGNPNINYATEFSAYDHCYVLQRKSPYINLKYVYYFLYHNLNSLKKFYLGIGLKNITKEKIKNIKISLPVLDCQKQIVKQLDLIFDCIKTSEDKIAQLKQLNQMIIEHQKLFGSNKKLQFKEVFIEAKTGQTLSEEDRQNQKKIYPFYGANGIIDHVENYSLEGQFLLTASRGSIGSLHISEGKFSWSNNVFVLKFENAIIMFYCFYYLQTVDFQKYQTGSAQPALNLSNLKKIPIHVPDLARQEEIVSYCQQNDLLIQQLEAEIERQKKLAKQILHEAIV